MLTIAVVVAADGNINDKVAVASETKAHNFDIALLSAVGRRLRHLVVDVHSVVAGVAHQCCQDLHDMIVASGGTRVLFASKHMITASSLLLKRRREKVNSIPQYNDNDFFAFITLTERYISTLARGSM